MIYDWYKIFNLTDFLATGLVSRTYKYYLEGVGLKDVLITQGNFTGMTIDDTFLCLDLNDKMPFEFNDKAIYKDENNDVWYGILNDD